jgi:site-specific DNA-methyltransferase (adenine-specific)
VVNIEDAGFEIRDQINWAHGEGFPKGMDIQKAIMKISGIGNDEAEKWRGWGTTLKPSHEPICVAMKPIDGKNVAKNVLNHGCGALNIGECRIGLADTRRLSGSTVYGVMNDDGWKSKAGFEGGSDLSTGRFPANLVLTHCVDCEYNGAGKIKGTRLEEFSGDEVKEAVEDWDCVDGCPCLSFPESHSGSLDEASNPNPRKNNVFGQCPQRKGKTYEASDGSASRFFKQTSWTGDDLASFFYCSKASKNERSAGVETSLGGPKRNLHPTVKPVDLMSYLCKLITPPGGIVLDPFCGSGSTGIGARLSGFGFIGIDRDEGWVEVSKRRIKYFRFHVKDKDGRRVYDKVKKPRTVRQQMKLFGPEEEL